MEVFTVSFFGHRQSNYLSLTEKELEKTIRDFIRSKEYVAFLVGRNGAFDLLVASVVRKCKCELRDDNSSLVLVLPYATAEYENNAESFQVYYDEIEICAASAQKHFKAAYSARNREMVDRSDVVCFYIEHEYGGAFQTMQYAKKRKKECINLFERIQEKMY